MTCPICGAALNVIGDLSEDGVESCPNGHYGYQHSYGSHHATYDVDGSGYISLNQAWHYSEEDSVRRLRDAARKAFLDYARAVHEKITRK